MFGRKYRLDMIDPTSKISLKLSCLRACDNSVERARELYGFLADGLAEIPDVEPVEPGTLDKVRQGATEIVAWLSSHRDDIAQGVSFVQTLRKPAAATAAASVPPIPKI